jgi:hypothetical protein
VASNSATAQRSGTITVQGQTHTVVQDGVSCSYAINPEARSFTASGGTGTIDVTTTAGCNWATTASAAWITITSGGSGSGNGTVNYSVAANTGAQSRQGMITVQGRTHTITQAGVQPCQTNPIAFNQSISDGLTTNDCRSPLRGGNYYADRYTFNGAAGQAIVVEVTAASFDTYIYLIGPSGGLLAEDDDGGVGTNSRIPANTGSFILPSSGTYIIEVTSFGASVTGTYTVRLTESMPCNYMISPASRSFSTSGGNGSIAVTAAAGCNWTAVSNSSWISIISGATGSGNGTVNYNVAQNNSSSPRTGTINVQGQIHTVTQSGGCNYSLSQGSVSVTATGGQESVAVSAPSTCTWKATIDVQWITFLSSDNGTGNGMIRFFVRENQTTASRKGTLTIADQLFSVFQDPRIDAPVISNAQVFGKSVRVFGKGFQQGAKILVNGVEQKTKNDSQSPQFILISKKGAKSVRVGDEVTIQVRNADGLYSNEYVTTKER